MDLINLFYILSGLSLFAALLVLTFKYFYYRNLRRKNQAHVHLKMLGLYSEEHITSTTSSTKRSFMVTANRATILMYICLLPSLILVLVSLVNLGKTLLQLVA